MLDLADGKQVPHLQSGQDVSRKSQCEAKARERGRGELCSCWNRNPDPNFSGESFSETSPCKVRAATGEMCLHPWFCFGSSRFLSFLPLISCLTLWSGWDEHGVRILAAVG